MSDLKELLDREARLIDAAPDALGSALRRRDRKRRNQRITAGVVGIAVFVAAVWIVTSGLSFDRTQTPIAPRPAVPGPVETRSPHAPAPAEPDVVKTRMCTDGARWRLEITDTGDQIKVRFEVHRSPPGHSWRIDLGHVEHKHLPLLRSHVLPRRQGGKRQRRPRGSGCASGLARQRRGRGQGG